MSRHGRKNDHWLGGLGGEMGTNYFAHEGVCPNCGASKKSTHIGKSSAGWTFSFRGYREKWDMPIIKSWKDWKEYLKQPGVLIRDEYGVAVDPAEFIKMVEDKQSAKNNHAKRALWGEWGWDYATTQWLDDEGYSFSGGEFS